MENPNERQTTERPTPAYEPWESATSMTGYYHAYLRDSCWKTKRASVLERDGGLCQFCKKLGVTTKATQVHHTSRAYEEMVMYGFGNESEEYLFSICASCHKKVHDKELSNSPEDIGKDESPTELVCSFYRNGRRCVVPYSTFVEWEQRDHINKHGMYGIYESGEDGFIDYSKPKFERWQFHWKGEPSFEEVMARIRREYEADVERIQELFSQ